MFSVENVTEVIDQEIDRLGIKSLTLQETIELLYSKGVFDASNPKSEKEFKALLKEGKIPQAYKESGRWKICKSTSIHQPLNFKIVYIVLTTIVVLFFITLKFSNYFEGSKENENLKKDVNRQKVYAPEIILDTVKTGFAQNMYNDTKSLESEGEVINSKKEGLWKFYNKNGVLKETVHFKNNQKNGVFKTYDEAGLLKERRNYFNDKLNGKLVKYFENGKESDVFTYKDGKKEGDYLGYDIGDVDGKERHYLIQKGFYRNDLKDGEWRYYDYYYDVVNKKMSGKLILTNLINYKNDKEEGRNIIYHAKEGWILIETYYKNGLEHGERKSYCPEGPDKGKLYAIQVFESGKSVKRYPYQCDCRVY